MPAILASIISAVQPFADWYSASAPVQTGTSFLHFAGLLTSGGFAIATDRAVWRSRRVGDIDGRRRVLDEIAGVHRPVFAGLTIVFITGAMLTLADAETFLTSVAYWTKMGLVALLLANGAWLAHTERQLSADPDPANARWRVLLAASTVSIGLWLAITLAGVILTNG